MSTTATTTNTHKLPTDDRMIALFVKRGAGNEATAITKLAELRRNYAAWQLPYELMMCHFITEYTYSKIYER